MKRAFGVIELLISAVIVLVLYFMFISPGGRSSNPFEDINAANERKQIIDEKINEINDTKLLREKIENNLNN